jgi:hypothetical protein
MKRTKPRGPVPSLIGGTNGRPKRVTAGKKSECSRCHMGFVKGDICIEIPKLGSAFSSLRRVCDDCFEAIIKKTYEDLEAIKGI